MSKKYVVDYLYRNYFNARSKAREDVNVSAQKAGYEMFFLKTQTTTEANESKTKNFSKYLHHIKKLIVIFDAILKIKKDSTVLVQYPLSPFGDFFSKCFYWALRKKSCKVIILVHDIVSYRETGHFSKKEIATLNQASHIILHTPAMKALFNSVGIKPSMSLLYLFDYITSELPNLHNTENYEVAFAGSLEKSVFLHCIHKIPFREIKLNLYGLPTDKIKETQDIRYCGKFSPENVNAIKSIWGLVWDGDSLETCSGVLGTYLRINSPHKTSLYLAAGIPIIIWAQSALAEYITKNCLGITISSLYEMDEKILKLTKDEINEIQRNVSVFSSKIRGGEMLKDVLNNL